MPLHSIDVQPCTVVAHHNIVRPRIRPLRCRSNDAEKPCYPLDNTPYNYASYVVPTKFNRHTFVDAWYTAGKQEFVRHALRGWSIVDKLEYKTASLFQLSSSDSIRRLFFSALLFARHGSMSMSPCPPGDPLHDSCIPGEPPKTFTVGTRTLQTPFAGRCSGPRRRRGTWFLLSAGRLVSTSHFVAVPVGTNAASVVSIPGRRCHLIEVIDQLGNRTRSVPPCIVRWPAGVTCHVRELKATCISVALCRAKTLPLNTAVVRAPAGTIVLGRIGRLRCTKCRAGFATPDKALHHFGLPPLEVRQTVKGGTVHYLEPRHSKAFQEYLDKCAENPLKMPTELLPQLNGDELRSKLDAVVKQRSGPPQCNK